MGRSRWHQWLISPFVLVGRVIAGIVLIVAGLIMAIPGVPGPGIAIAAVGVLVLAPNSRLAHWIRRKGRQARQWYHTWRGGGGPKSPSGQ